MEAGFCAKFVRILLSPIRVRQRGITMDNNTLEKPSECRYVVPPYETLFVDGHRVRIFYTTSPDSRSLKELEKLLLENFSL